MGISTESGGLLAPTDLAFLDAGREPLWSASRRVSLHECGVSCRERRFGFPVAPVVDGGVVAECGGGCAVCPASAAGGVGRLGDRTEGCLERFLRLALPALLRRLRATENAEGRRQNAESGDPRHAPRNKLHVSRRHLLSSIPWLVRLRPDERSEEHTSELQ